MSGERVGRMLSEALFGFFVAVVLIAWAWMLGQLLASWLAEFAVWSVLG